MLLSYAQSCPALCDPMDCCTPGLPVHCQILEFTQTLTLRGLKQTLCAPGPRDPTETKSELCLSVSCGGMGWQRSAAGTAALGVGIAYVLLEEITVDPTMELPELA